MQTDGSSSCLEWNLSRNIVKKKTVSRTNAKKKFPAESSPQPVAHSVLLEIENSFFLQVQFSSQNGLGRSDVENLVNKNSQKINFRTKRLFHIQTFETKFNILHGVSLRAAEYNGAKLLCFKNTSMNCRLHSSELNFSSLSLSLPTLSVSLHLSLQRFTSSQATTSASCSGSPHQRTRTSLTPRGTDTCTSTRRCPGNHTHRCLGRI